MARWQSLGPDSGKVVLDGGKTFKARPGLFGGWKAAGESAWSGEELARKLERKHAKTGKGKAKSGGGFFSDDNWKLWG